MALIVRVFFLIEIKILLASPTEDVMSYSIEFLDDPNWDGAGLDLEFRLVFDQPMLITADDLVCIRTTEVKIVRWECLTHKGSECGRSLTALDLFLRTIGEVKETIMLQLKVMEQEFYLEISPPL